MSKHDNTVLLPAPMPVDRESERVLLGCLLLNNDLIAEIDLVPEKFGVDRHKRIFRSMLNCHTRGLGVDPIILRDDLASAGDLDAIGGAAYIAMLFDGVPSFSNVDSYVRIIKEKAARREMIHVANYASNLAYDESESVTDQLNDAQKRFFDIDLESASGGLIEASTLAWSSLQEIENIAATGRPPGILTGLRDFDLLTGGLKEGDFVVVGGRPGMGKTVIASTIALGVARSSANRDRLRFKDESLSNIPPVVAFFEGEMTSDQLVKRMLSSLSGIEHRRVVCGDMDQVGWKRLAIAVEELAALNISIDDSAGMTINSIRKRLRKLVAQKHRLDLVVVDYLQLLRPSRSMNDTRKELEEISRDLKVLAKEFRVPVMALASLSRSCEGRPDKRPLLSDLRESGQIEHDADIVAFTYRDHVYHPEAPETVAELIIRKQRSGPLGTVDLFFDGPLCRFSNMAPAPSVTWRRDVPAEGGEHA
jgi:replicative DNA helicase